MKRANEHPDESAVSAAYRETATERVPDNLDRAVLKEAALAAAKGSRKRGRWIRPLAFAATVGLSLAIVLEITGSPELNAPLFDGAAETATFDDSARPQSREDRDTLPTRSRQAPLAGGNTAPAMQQAPEAKQKPDGPASVRLEAEPVGRQDIKKESDVFTGALEEARSSVREEQEKAAARLPAQTPAATPMELSADLYLAPESTEFACEPAVRSDPESWLACIESLQDGGRAEEAALELLEFERAYPDGLPAQ